MAQAQMYPITDGDSKDKLLAQLFDIGRLEFNQRPKFRVSLSLPLIKGPASTWLNIIGLKAEDGSGDNWIIYGYSTVPDLEYFEGFYNSRTRKGWLKNGAKERD